MEATAEATAAVARVADHNSRIESVLPLIDTTYLMIVMKEVENGRGGGSVVVAKAGEATVEATAWRWRRRRWWWRRGGGGDVWRS